MHVKNPSLHRVLVTGGAGYVGAMLVPALLATVAVAAAASMPAAATQGLATAAQHVDDELVQLRQRPWSGVERGEPVP